MGKLNLSLCPTTEILQTPTMQSMQTDSASLPLFQGGEGSLEEFLMETPNMMTDLDIGKMLAANIDTHTATLETREDVWGPESFSESFDLFSTTMDYGLCLPATLVEGSLAASDDSLIVPESDPVALEECENIDILQWIVEDQDIDPLAACQVAQPEQPAEVSAR